MKNKLWNQKGVTKQVGAEKITEEGQEPRLEGGTEITFYPLPIGMLMRVKNTCKEAAPFMAMCFTDSSKDNDIETLNSVTEEGEGVYPVTNVHTKAVSPSISSHRFQQKQRGIESLIDALFADATRDLLADMIIASAPETFSPEDKTDLLEDTPSNIFFELLGGVFEASSGAFAGLGEFLPRLMPNSEVLAGGVEKIKDMTAKPE